MKKRIVSLLVAVCLIISATPTISSGTEIEIEEEIIEDTGEAVPENIISDRDESEYQDISDYKITGIQDSQDSMKNTEIIEEIHIQDNGEDLAVKNEKDVNDIKPEMIETEEPLEVIEISEAGLSGVQESEMEPSDSTEIFSAEGKEGVENRTRQHISTTFINPLFKDIINNDEIETATAANSDDIMPLAGSVVCDTYEQAGEILRNAMKQRQEAVQIDISFFYWAAGNDPAFDTAIKRVCDAILDEALLDTGNPTEGDYLKHQWISVNFNYDVSIGAEYGPTSISVFPVYLTTREQEQEVDIAINNLKEQLELDQKDNYEKIKSIYYWIISNVKYVDSGKTLEHSAYGALINKECVCQGYAVLLYRLLEEAGLDSRVISGYDSEQFSPANSHMWNIVDLFGKYYYLDSTWDSNNYQKNGDTAFYYFLHGSSDWDRHFPEDHVIEGYAISTENCPKMKNIISAEDISYEASEETQTFSIDADIVYKAPLHYESDNSAITVDENGIVTVPANMNETATITITADAIHDYDAAETTITVSENISLSFWEDEECKTPVVSMINTCGSFSWETNSEETNFNKLYMRAGLVASKDAGLFKVGFTAPAGFSFAEKELITKYEQDFSSVKKGIEYTAVIPIYPIYLSEYEDILTVGVTTAYDGEIDEVLSYKTIPVDKNQMEGEIYYRDSFSEGLTGPYYLHNINFDGFKDVPTKYNHSLSSLCASLSAAVYKKTGMENTYKNLGFTDTKFSNYSSPDDQVVVNRNQVACAFATKKMIIDNKIYTIVSVTIRGTVGEEWESNFDITGNSSRHKGFENANMFVKKELTNYLNRLNLDKDYVKLLITGHSRAAAVADLLAVDLNTGFDSSYVLHDNIYVYTFAAPNSIPRSVTYPEEAQDNIFNIMNMSDVVCHVPADYYSPGKNLYMNHFADSEYSVKLEQFKIKFKQMTGNSDYQTWRMGNNIISSLDNSLSLVPNAYISSHKKGLSDVMLRKFDTEEARVVLRDLIGFTYLIGGIPALVLVVNFGEHFQNCIWNNHCIEMYMCWMEMISSVTDYEDVKCYRNVTIKCPVDVSLYDKNGVLVTQIVNNEIIYSDGPYCSVIDEEKIFCFGDDGYRFKITGYDTGTMDIDIEEYDKDNKKIQQTNYIDIPVSKNETVTLRTENGVGTSGASYSMQLPDGTEKIADVSASGDMLDNVEISVVTTGNGSVFGAGNYTNGEKVSLTAVEDNSSFLGWYIDGKRVSREYTYSFICKENVEITAQFADSELIDIESCDITVYGNNYIYDGTEKKPSVSVYYGNNLLTENIDYTLQYFDNVNAGTARLIVSGTGSYIGTAEIPFNINKAEQKASVSISSNTLQVGATAALKVSGKGSVRFTSNNMNIASVNEKGIVTGINQGTAQITVAFSGNSNYEEAKAVVSVVVSGIEAEPGFGKQANIIKASDRSLTYSKKKRTFNIGATAMDNAKLTYQSNNKSVVVNRKGKVKIKAKFTGKAVITITSAKTKKYQSTVKKITIIVKPAKTSLSSVKNAGTGKIKVKWKRNLDVSGYQIQYSLSKKFNKNVRTILIKKNQLLSRTLSGFRKGKTYYFRIRTFKKAASGKYYSGWSKKEKIKVK